MSKSKIHKKIELLGFSPQEYSQLCNIAWETFRKNIKLNNNLPSKKVMATICEISKKFSKLKNIPEGEIFVEDFYESNETQYIKNPFFQNYINDLIKTSNLIKINNR